LVPTDGFPSGLESSLPEHPCTLLWLGTGRLGAAVGHGVVADAELRGVAQWQGHGTGLQQCPGLGARVRAAMASLGDLQPG